MKFTYLLSSLLAALVAASPIVVPEAITDVKDLVVRAAQIVETDTYKAAIKAKAGLVKDKYYWFKLQWPLGSLVDSKTSEEMLELQKSLGFDHIGVVVGQIKETPSGVGTKNEKLTKDFVATLYHMIKTNVSPGDTG